MGMGMVFAAGEGGPLRTDWDSRAAGWMQGSSLAALQGPVFRSADSLPFPLRQPQLGSRLPAEQQAQVAAAQEAARQQAAQQLTSTAEDDAAEITPEPAGAGAGAAATGVVAGAAVGAAAGGVFGGMLRKLTGSRSEKDKEAAAARKAAAEEAAAEEQQAAAAARQAEAVAIAAAAASPAMPSPRPSSISGEIEIAPVMVIPPGGGPPIPMLPLAALPSGALSSGDMSDPSLAYQLGIQAGVELALQNSARGGSPSPVQRQHSSTSARRGGSVSQAGVLLLAWAGWLRPPA